MIVELEKGVWLTDGEGDPARTTVKENAKEFESMTEATHALIKAREYRDFDNALIEDKLF